MLCAYVGYVQWAMFMHPLKPWVIITALHTDMRYRTKMSARNHYVSVTQAQHHVINSTNPRCAFYDRSEHWLPVGRRTTDDAEHFGRCRLMFEGLTQLCV